MVGPEGLWFELRDQPRFRLGRRRADRRVLLALVEQRLLAPGVGLSTDFLFESGWPDEEVNPVVASSRVYKSIDRLRKAGLDPILHRHADGYLLDVGCPVALVNRG